MGSDLNRETIYLKALVQAVSNSQDGKKLVELTNSIQNS